MAYWIQEYGSQQGNNRADWKMFHCDYKTDIAKLPTRTKEGEATDADPVAHQLAKAGDQCFCLEDSTVFELRYEPDDWKEL